MGDLGNFIVNCLRVVIDGGRLGMDVNKQVQNTNTRIFMSQIDRWFGEGIELLELGLEDDDGVREEVQDPTTSSAWNLDTLNIHLVDNWRSISRLSLATARPKFQASRFFARIVVLNKRSYNNDQLFAIKAGILSVAFLYMDRPENAVTGCMRDLNWMNSLLYVSRLLSLYFKKVNEAVELNKKVFKFVPLTIVATTNYFVYHFIEKYAENVLSIQDWPRIRLSAEISVHPIRSIAFRVFAEEVHKSTYVRFNAPIDAIDMAVNRAGKIIMIGLDQSKETVVQVYSDGGELEFAVYPTEEQLDGKLFQPYEVFTDDEDAIYVYSRSRKTKNAEESDALLFVFNRDGKQPRIIPVEYGFMALEKVSGKIFISSERGIFVYENTGELRRSFAPPEALKGSARPLTVCGENTIIQTDVYHQESNVYLLNDTGEEIRQFQLKQSQGWAHIAFNSLSGEILVSYLAKDLNRFQLDVYSENGQFLSRIDLPDNYSSHPRSLITTSSGLVAVLYQNVVHFI